MEKVIEHLKKRNRILLEMHIGILVFGALCQIIGAFLVEDQRLFALSLWFGIAFAFCASIHMYRNLDRALWYGADASKLVMRGYLFRYAMVLIVLVIICVTEVMNPLVVFLGYMSLKVTAYIQPITHKFCNKLFHETDPIPEALEEDAVSEGESSVH